MLGIRASHENRRAECRARQCQRLLETCQPAACMPCPRLAAGSLSHQAQRADGLGHLAHSKVRARGRVQETSQSRTWAKLAQASAGNSWPWARFYTELGMLARLSAHHVNGGPTAGMQACRPIR